MRESVFQKMLSDTGAFLSGHFLLSSGLHSSGYLQCAMLLSRPVYAAALCKDLAVKLKKQKADIVIGPAYGGILVAYELARALQARAMFAERKDSVMQLRRGFAIKKGERVLIAEDVITTGRSVKEVMVAIKPYRPDIIGVASLIDRSAGSRLFGRMPFCSVKALDIKTYPADKCPLCKSNIPMVKPGSRQRP
ncbi:MAG: orotate phosphoribosyltransferase [Candidatus Omnitrophota bacterium]